MLALAIKILNYGCSAGLPFKKEVNLIVFLGFPHFVLWKKNLCTVFVLYNKKM